MVAYWIFLYLHIYDWLRGTIHYSSHDHNHIHIFYDLYISIYVYMIRSGLLFWGNIISLRIYNVELLDLNIFIHNICLVTGYGLLVLFWGNNIIFFLELRLKIRKVGYIFLDLNICIWKQYFLF